MERSSAPAIQTFFLEDLAVDSSGNVYASAVDLTNCSGTIYKFTSAGARSIFGTTPGQIFGLAFDAAGNLFAADATYSVIYKFAPNGMRSVFVDATAFDPTTSPVGLAF